MMKKFSLFFVLILFALSIPGIVYAHCPLCTAGAGALAVLAASLGVSTAAIGIFIGAFAVALGLWFSRLLKKEFVPGQKWLIVVGSFLLTVWPLTPLLTSQYGSVFISWFGDYGSIFNRTYIWNWFVVTSIIGGLLMIVAPWVSKFLTKLRQGKRFPYQGMSIALLLLVLMGLIFQFTVR